MKFELSLLLLVLVLGAYFAWLLYRNAQSLSQSTRLRPARHKGLRRHWRKLYLAPIGLHRIVGYMPGVRRPPAGVQFANINQGTFDTGVKTYIADAATAGRYLLYKKGTDVDHSAICGAGDDPLGSSDDQAVAGEPIA